MSDDLTIDMTFDCAECGKRFEATPDSFVETGFVAVPSTEADDDEEVPSVTPAELAAMSEFALSEIGLTPSDRDEILKLDVTRAGEHVPTGAVAMCDACREKIFGKEGES